MNVNKSMLRVSRKQREGFSVLELVLMLIVVGLLCLAGYMAYDARTKSMITASKSAAADQKPTVQPGSAEDVSDRFVDAMMKGDADKAYQLTSPDYRALTNQTQTQVTFDGIKAKITKMPVKFSGQMPNQKTYRYMAQGAQGPQTLVIRLQSVNSKWLIYGFQLYEAQL